jgi:dGTPase
VNYLQNINLAGEKLKMNSAGGKFLNVAANESNEKCNNIFKRENSLYKREDDIRTEFGRDYTRILHSLAYRRLKHKTQVFFNTQNDQICTRIEHVNHVESVSFTIANYLGLNTELTKAIAVGHDLGHAPFGHQGEDVIKNLTAEFLGEKFWHEKNGLHFVDNIELLEDDNRCFKNLNLTYAVRDGIISHCGELDENTVKPRDAAVDLSFFKSPGDYQPYTWEGCVVKVSDKIAYIGRDIEDAVRLDFIDESDIPELNGISEKYNLKAVNTTNIIHRLIIDLCKNSSPENGLVLSAENVGMLDDIKKYNYKYIYKSKKFDNFKKYSELVLKAIFNKLTEAYDGSNTVLKLEKLKKPYPELINDFSSWIEKYCDTVNKSPDNLQNKKIYGALETEKQYIRAIIDYISGMTDQYAVKIFNELIRF